MADGNRKDSPIPFEQLPPEDQREIERLTEKHPDLAGVADAAKDVLDETPQNGEDAGVEEEPESIEETARKKAGISDARWTAAMEKFDRPDSLSLTTAMRDAGIGFRQTDRFFSALEELRQSAPSRQAEPDNKDRELSPEESASERAKIFAAALAEHEEGLKRAEEIHAAREAEIRERRRREFREMLAGSTGGSEGTSFSSEEQTSPDESQ